MSKMSSLTSSLNTLPDLINTQFTLRMITSFRRLTKRRTTINTLPPEVLAYIMSLFCLELRLGWRYPGSRRDFLPLTHVCAKWRAVALATKKLWTHVDMGCPDLVPVVLQRSEDVGVHVHYIIAWSSNPTDEEIRLIWQPILSSSRRVTSLRIEDWSGDASRQARVLNIIQDPQLSWPQLNEVDFHGDHQFRRRFWIDWTAVVPLRRLTLFGAEIPFISPAFGSSLRHLHLECIELTRRMLFSILRRCTRLEKLTLKDLRLDIPHDTPGAWDRTFRFRHVDSRTLATSVPFGPGLRHLHLADIPMSMAVLLLFLKQTPQLETLIVSGLNLPDNDVGELGEVRLDSLRWINVCGIHRGNTISALERLKVSITAFIHISIPRGRYSEERIKDFVDLYPAHHLALVRLRQNESHILQLTLDTAAVNWHQPIAFPSQYSQTPRQDIDALALSLHQSASFEILSLLCTSLGSPNSQELTILCPEVCSRHFTTEHWRKALARFPNLQHFCAVDDSVCFNMLLRPLRALASLTNDEGRQLPCLQKITLRFRGWLNSSCKEWTEISAHLRRLCDQGRKLKELWLVGLTAYRGFLTNEDKKVLDALLRPYVGQIYILTSSNKYLF